MITQGTQLGPYEVLSQIGAGGMGEVYRGRDPRLGREVAIKILPAQFSEHPDRVRRFEQEARAAGMLNHPNILTIYDIGEHEGSLYVVSELLIGETLRERMGGSPIPARKTIEFALQIAHGLAAAHEKGIVHRDLKPENLFITRDGRVKILDFGLAKLTAPESVEGPHSKLETKSGATEPGMVMGTMGYMSPEQVRGQEVDHRSDIFTFGAILYEMLSGKKAFQRGSGADTMSAILKEDPPIMDATNRNYPPALEHLIRHCLEKNAEQRFQSARDLAFDLEMLSGISGSEFSQTAGPVAVVPKRSGKNFLLAIALLAAVALGVFIGQLENTKSGMDSVGSHLPQHLAIQLATDQQLGIGNTATLAFSPDGRSLVFHAVVDGRRVLLRRELGKREATEIPGTEDGEAPFFSPDGRWLGFIARNQLMKVSIEGGRPIRLSGMNGAGGACWLSDDTIVFAPIYSDGLFRIAAEGGTPERLTTPDRSGGVLGHWWPEPLPGEKWILFTAFRTPVDTSRVGAINLETKEVRWLVEGGFFGRYIATGHLLYVKGQRLYASRFDADTISTIGSPQPVLDDLLAEQTGGFAMIAVAGNGTLAYVTESGGHPKDELVWLDRAGHSTKAIEEPQRYMSVSLSPGDRQAALTIHGESRDLWIYSFERGTLSRMTSGEDTEFDPAWSPDGRELFYVVDSPPFQLYRISVGVPDSGRPIWKDAADLDTLVPTMSPNGGTIVFTLSENETGTNLYARPLDGSEAPRPIRASRSAEEYPTFSPDGRWLAYQSDETGRPEIYVEAFPGPGDRFQISADGGREPLWAANGEIFFRHGNEIRVVSARYGGRLEFDTPRTLFTSNMVAYTGGAVASRLYDVSEDGQRILAIVNSEILRPRQIQIITNWTSELERLVPHDTQ